MRVRCGALVAWSVSLVILVAACGSSQSSSGASSTPLTLGQVRANLVKAGYKVTVYPRNEGVLQIDSAHKADGGLSIDYGPDGKQLYATVYETRDPAVRAAVISRNSDEATPVVRGELIFTISGTEPELETIVRAAGDAAPSGAVTPSSSDTGAARDAMQRFINVYAAGDEPAICASLTPAVRAKSQTFCDPSSIFYKRKPDARVKQYSITSVTTSGDSATVVVMFEGVTEQVPLRRLDGRWKIDAPLGAGRLL